MCSKRWLSAWPKAQLQLRAHRKLPWHRGLLMNQLGQLHGKLPTAPDLVGFQNVAIDGVPKQDNPACHTCPAMGLASRCEWAAVREDL